MAMQPLAFDAIGNPEGASGGLYRGLRRLGATFAVLVMALVLAGDRTRAGMVPATVYGQDPLEVLELKVRPNVFIVLDSSGSMKWGGAAPASPSGPPGNFYPPQAGDHPRSKVWQAKQVLKQIVTDNQDDVSFLMGQYTQSAVIQMENRPAATAASGTANRFQYWTSTTLSPSMATTELAIRNDSGGSGERGLQSWQLIYAGWNTLYYEETQSGTDPVCTATLPGPFPKFYRTGAQLATELQAAMNGAACAPARSAGFNVYSVTYNTGSGVFTISRTGASTRNFMIRWADNPNNMRGAMNAGTANTTEDANPKTTGTPFSLLYRTDTTAASNAASYNTGQVWRAMNYEFTETVAGAPVGNFNAWAGRFFNGEVIDVLNTAGASFGQICNMTFPTPAERTNPPSFTLRGVTACGAAPTTSVRFDWGGPFYDGNNSIGCNGFEAKVQLVPCDLRPPAPTQVATIHPWLDNEFPLDSTGMPHPAPRNLYLPAPATTAGYTEAQDGTWATATFPPYQAGGIKAMGSTPVANSIANIDTLFTGLWTTGQTGATTMAGPPPYQLDAISNHANPKEKTILIFVTDGADTCSGSGDPAALTTAQNARNLFQPVAGGCKDSALNGNFIDDPGDSLTSTPPCQDVDRDGVSGFAEPASSVQTFMIGYGDGVGSPADINRLNWVGWGGSGLYANFPSYTGSNAVIDGNLRVLRNQCSTCQDAFIAPDAATLAAQLQSIINQGAQDGDISAQQSITETVFEYVDVVDPAVFDAATPSQRYKAIVPTRFISSFTLPGFRGQVNAFQNDGAGGTLLKWSAGNVLRTQIANGMSPAGGVCIPVGIGGRASSECVLGELNGNGTLTSAAIQRRIYTTDRNGAYPYTPDSLMDGTSANRVQLWPPPASVLPNSFTALSPFDDELGLPPDAPTSFPPNPVDPRCDALDLRPVALPKKAFDQCWFEWMQSRFRACAGTPLPGACTTAPYSSRMQAARRETREMILAFMAGAETVPAGGGGIKRTTAVIGSAAIGSPFYRPNAWMLADSECATAAVVTPPLPSEPEATPYVDPEYKLFRDGPRQTSGALSNADSLGLQLKMGFGLRSPDDDGQSPTGVDSRRALKPAMTVIYAPGNDMLHAFRAGPCFTPDLGPGSVGGAPNCVAGETGGQELWGFVPYDQMNVLRLRLQYEPQTRQNHVYMLARGVRFSDVFVPGSYTRTIAGMTVASSRGLWRRILYFGRGIGGKYLTAIDVTAPGPYTEAALDTTPPIPLWSRGNPDTADGLPAGSASGTPVDTAAYAKMGETWSIPVVAYVDKTAPIYRGRDYVLFLGSGYGGVAEGTTFYTLDALTGEVLASADVGSRAGFSTYANALVANPVGFNPKNFSLLTTVHPAASQVTRVYIGDLHGRLWKFLTGGPTARPDIPLQAADLGSDQPVATAASLLGLPPQPAVPIPSVFVTSGNESRANGPFRVFGFQDTGSDTDFAVGAGATATAIGGGSVTAFAPVNNLHARTFDQGTPQFDCGYTEEAIFRGTIQPTTAFECSAISSGTCSSPVGRVFFAGTRLSLPNTRFAPITPLACGSGQYPCRSQFDTIIYALGAATGNAAYDLNAAGDDAYRIFRDSRIAAITVLADPDPARGGSSFTADEGLVKGVPKPPPPPGVPPTATTATANVVMARAPGQPAPAVRYGTTVCQ